MKSILVKELKNKGIRKIGGRKVETYNFYQLVGFIKRMENGEILK